MSGQRYIPDYRVKIDGDPIPAALRASIADISLVTGLKGADRLEIKLVNENLRWLDDPLLALDRELRLSIGYADDTLEQMFVGEIISHSASFPAGGSPQLMVAAQDRIHRLQKGKGMRWFALPTPMLGNFPLPDPAAASAALLESELIPITDPIAAALFVILGAIDVAALATSSDPDGAQRLIRKQVGESDYDFLQKLAEENGWEMFIEHAGPLGGHLLRFQALPAHLDPDVTLRYGQSIIEFTPKLSTVCQILSVTAFLWVVSIKTQIAVTVSWDWDRQSLNLRIRPSLIPEREGPSDFLIDEPLTPLSAPRKIMSKLIPILNGRLTASGSTVGDPRIRAGSVIQIEGLGEEFSGRYRVTSATHTLGSGGYQTSFELRKEIWFGSIPLPEQGAIPVQAFGT